MKNMKRIITLFCILLVLSITSAYAQCCKNAAKSASCAATCAQSQQTSASEIKAYYFHATRRCATCMAVEDVTKEVLKANYANKIPFVSINRDEDSKNPLLEKYKVSGQTLLLVKGDKVVDLTNDAFLYARIKPEKFKEKLKSTIDSMK
jgi:hypothetical protein